MARCQFCGATNHESSEFNAQCQQELMIARSRVTQQVRETEAAEVIKADQLKVVPFELRQVDLYGMFVRAGEVGANPTDPPVWVKLNSYANRSCLCLEFRSGKAEHIKADERIMRVRVNALEMEYMDVLAIAEIVKVVAKPVPLPPKPSEIIAGDHVEPKRVFPSAPMNPEYIGRGTKADGG